MSAPDSDLLALRPEYAKLKAAYDAYDANPDPWIEDAGKPFDEFCLMVIGMPAAITPAGLAFKAQVALAQHVYVDDDWSKAFQAIRSVLGEVVTAGQPSQLATLDHMAALTFEGVPRAVAALGDRAQWMENAAEWWIPMRLGLAALELDHDDLSKRVAGLTEEHIDLAQKAGRAADYLEGCIETLRATEVRVMADGAHHLASVGAA